MRPKDETLRDPILTGVKRNGTLIIKVIGKETGVCRAEEQSAEVNFKKRTWKVSN